jgi:hypothetical protein
MNSSIPCDVLLSSTTSRLQSPVLLVKRQHHYTSVRSCAVVRGRTEYSEEELLPSSSGTPSTTPRSEPSPSEPTGAPSASTPSSEPSAVPDYRRPDSIYNHNTTTGVRWNEMAAPAPAVCGRIDPYASSSRTRMGEVDSSVPPQDCLDTTADNFSGYFSSRTSLKRRLEAKIKKAAHLELAYLNKAKEAQNKRKEWAQLYKMMTNLPGSGALNLNHSIEEIQKKAQSSHLMEKSYLKKAKAVHDQRYRWTKICEHSSRELGQRPECSTTELPPLLPPSFTRKRMSQVVF